MSEEPRAVPLVVVAGLLRLIASGLEPITAEEITPGCGCGVQCANGWWLWLWADAGGQLREVLHAQPPSVFVLPWTRGGVRDDWTAAETARVITPVELLTAEQRERLQGVVQRAPRPWQWARLPYWDVDWGDEELIFD